MKNILSFTFLLFFSLSVQSQILNPVKWSYAAKKINDKEAVVFLKATIQPGWNIYSQFVDEGGPVPTSFVFSPSKNYSLVGKTGEPKPASKFEKTFNMNVKYFQNSAVFQQKVKLNAKETTVDGTLEYMACNDKQCLPPKEVKFSVVIK
ncbi:protein-disulfide reductase DsbD domain-containing protein [Pseudopedobacter beijingensis]|uniref:Protein-disulfide reductase DsbD domain-containing protein n=1 Tax=Pseudopedobacter beijingensis TaxID=1207056 RepID=A0ABW4I9E7_9SPHI